MVYKRFNVQVAIRLIFLMLTCVVLAYVFRLDQLWLVKGNLMLFLLLQTYLFFHFLTRWRRDLRIFAESVKHNDYSITFRKVHDMDAYQELYGMLNDINDYVKEVKSAYVQQNHYFQYVVENAQVGMIAYDQTGTVLLCNREALLLAGVQELRRITQLRDFNRELSEQLNHLQVGQPRLIILRQKEIKKISARLSEITIDEKKVFLLSLMNIRNELEENELQSWQDLINVLTHEIMNSVTPISSLTGNMIKYMDRIEGNHDTIVKAKNSLDVIARRSNALMDFVNRYRTISNVPLPRLQETDIAKVITSVQTLLEDELKDIDVQVSHNHEKLMADVSQLEQVLINLLRNAIHALAGCDSKKIVIRTARTDEKVVITISDNGKGIPQAILEKIFIPFYTTRKEGSGIGLTFSKQIMHRHGGYIEVHSQEDTGTSFHLIFTGKVPELLNS